MNKNIVLFSLSVLAFLSLFLPWKDHPLVSITGWEWSAWWVLLPWIGVVVSTQLPIGVSDGVRGVSGVGLIGVGGFSIFAASSLEVAGAGSGLVLFVSLCAVGVVTCFVRETR